MRRTIEEFQQRGLPFVAHAADDVVEVVAVRELAAGARERALDWIWRESESFNRFRGTEWMPEPCQSCPQKEIDFGGCRCQAALITGNAANTDPVCEFSPDRGHQRVHRLGSG